MRPFDAEGSAQVFLALQREIRRSWESRYDHRLHAVLLVARGLTCPEVASLLGEAPRSVQYWVRRFHEKGPAGLLERKKAGRPKRLNEKQLNEIRAVLRRAPAELGLEANRWEGRLLSSWVRQQHGIHLGVRQCQRLIRDCHPL